MKKSDFLRMLDTHKGLVCILTIYVLLCLTYSLLVPLGEAPDEEPHFSFVRFIAEKGRLPQSREERRRIGYKADSAPLYHIIAASATSLIEVEGPPGLKTIDLGRHMLPYDGLRGDGILHTEDEAFPYRGIVLAWHLARLLSILMGMAVIILTYAIALEVFPGRRRIALGAAAINGLIPQFVFLSSVVNDDNLAIPLCSLALLLMLRITNHESRVTNHESQITNRSARYLLLMGLVIGLAAVTKYHTLILLLEATLVIFIVSLKERAHLGCLLKRLGTLLAGFISAAGWWFAYLEIRFNEIATRGVVAGLLAPLGDPVMTVALEEGPPNLSELLYFWSRQGDWFVTLFKSFWALFGGMNIEVARGIYAFLAAICLLSVIGLLFGRSMKPKRLHSLILVLHPLCFLAIVIIRYSLSPQSFLETAQGRHLFPAISAISFFFFLGLARLVGEGRIKALTPTIGLSLGGLTAYCLLAYILPAYEPPLPVRTIPPKIEQPFHVAFEWGLEFLGYEVGGMTKEGLPVTLYWRAGEEMQEDYIIGLCLANAEDLVSCADGHPVNGRYPTRAWDKGDIVRDRRFIWIPPCIPSGPLRLLLQIHSPTEGKLAELELTEVQMNAFVGHLPSLEVREGTNLVGYELTGEGFRIRQTVRLTTYWRGETDALAVSLVGDEGYIWKPFRTLVACAATPSKMSIAQSNFIVDSKVPPGSYRLRIEGTEAGPILSVRTRRRNFLPPPIANPMGVDFGGELELLGYDLEEGPHRPGDVLCLKLHWRAKREMSKNYAIFAHLLDTELRPWGKCDKIPLVLYSTVLWAEGEVVSDEWPIPIASDAPLGVYSIKVGVYTLEGGKFIHLPVLEENEPIGEAIFIGPIKVLEEVPQAWIRKKLRANLGGKVELVGYDLYTPSVKAGELLRLALYWRAIAEMETDYTVFVHLLDSGGRLVAQKDNQPLGGRYPTSFWEKGELVRDPYEIPIPQDLPAGDYTIEVGMYELATMQRLPAFDAKGRHLPYDRIILRKVMVERD